MWEEISSPNKVNPGISRQQLAISQTRLSSPSNFNISKFPPKKQLKHCSIRFVDPTLLSSSDVKASYMDFCETTKFKVDENKHGTPYKHDGYTSHSLHIFSDGWNLEGSTAVRATQQKDYHILFIYSRNPLKIATHPHQNSSLSFFFRMMGVASVITRCWNSSNFSWTVLVWQKHG